MDNDAKVIVEIIKNRQCPVSARGLAHYAEIDAPSEVLRAIEDKCWDLVNARVLVALDYREQGAALFFDVSEKWVGK